jgi:hypothetical protein
MKQCVAPALTHCKEPCAWDGCKCFRRVAARSASCNIICNKKGRYKDPCFVKQMLLKQSTEKPAASFDEHRRNSVFRKKLHRWRDQAALSQLNQSRSARSERRTARVCCAVAFVCGVHEDGCRTVVVLAVFGHDLRIKRRSRVWVVHDPLRDARA